MFTLVKIMNPSQTKLSIDSLIEIVRQGGKVKTGIDVYSQEGVLLLARNVLIKTPKPLLVIKKRGISYIPIDPEMAGGVWDNSGRKIEIRREEAGSALDMPRHPATELSEKMHHITELKHEAAEKYSKAKENIKKVIQDIKETGGEFDYDVVENTVMDLLSLITQNDSAFFYLTKEIFSYDDYLYHHSINVCTIGTAILKKYNKQFKDTVTIFSPEASFQIAIGFFLHDVGKVLIPDTILNKAGNLTDQEFELIKTHSYEKGMIILEKNRIADQRIKDIVTFHHSALINGEPRCYPAKKAPADLPREVKICKLADIYDAMTSRRVYKEAFNPVEVVTEIVRKYAGSEMDLKLLLHAFAQTVGIYPVGSIVFLTNHQMAYVLDSDGPLVIPFTDRDGNQLARAADPINMGAAAMGEARMGLDVNLPLLLPTEAFQLIPENLKELILN